MEWNLRPEFRPEASFWLYLALLMLLLPLNWVISALAAAAFHELSHLAVMKKLGVPVYSLRLRWGGAVLETGTMTPGEEFLCAAAGPAGSFLLAFLVHIVPRLGICALAQGIYNLIPLGERDGRRILRYIIPGVRGKIPCKPGKIKVQ